MIRILPYLDWKQVAFLVEYSGLQDLINIISYKLIPDMLVANMDGKPYDKN